MAAFYDAELARLLPVVEGVALVAVGSLARREPAPYGDIDLVIVHSGLSDIGKIADQVWYPLWDAGIPVDHSVRTIAESMRAAEDDLAVALGLIEARPIAGDTARALELRTKVRALWRRAGRRRVAELAAAATDRTERFGELAFLLEPDVKNAFGGLREIQALHGLAVAQLADAGNASIRSARDLLLDVRGELHHRAGRSLDRLVQQEQPGIAETIGLPDANALLRAVSQAGRTIAYGWESALRRVAVTRRGPVRRRPLADGVVAHGGEVTLAKGVARDPALLLRCAGAAAESGLPISAFTLRSFAELTIPQPWPAAARQALVALLETGRSLVPVVETLDQAGLWVRLLPEWAGVRFLPQRDPVHRFTVDRHLIETAAGAAARVREVARPDLLLLAALLHDIGKGRGGDHSEIGADIAETMLTRLGLPAADRALVVGAVRHHLLLPDTATRRDLADPATIALVVKAIDGSTQLLEILAALAIADGEATGPAAWNRWKAGLVADLVRRVRASLAGSALPSPPALTERQRALAGRTEVLVEGGEVVVAAPDPALLSGAAGVFALHQLDVRQAAISPEMVAVFTVEPRFGRPPDPARLRADLLRFLPDPAALQTRLAALERAYPAAAAPAQVLWFDDAATGATVVELRAANAIGLLYRVAAGLERTGVDVRAARISTLGSAVVDAFYLRAGNGPVASPALRTEIERALLAAAAASPRRS